MMQVPASIIRVFAVLFRENAPATAAIRSEPHLLWSYLLEKGRGVVAPSLNVGPFHWCTIAGISFETPHQIRGQPLSESASDVESKDFCVHSQLFFASFHKLILAIELPESRA